MTALTCKPLRKGHRRASVVLGAILVVLLTASCTAEDEGAVSVVTRAPGGEGLDERPPGADIVSVRVIVESSDLKIEYTADSEFVLDSPPPSGDWPTWWVIFWRPDVEVPVNVAFATAAPDRPMVFVCTNEPLHDPAFPGLGMLDFWTALGGGPRCDTHSERSGVEAGGSILTVTIPLDEVWELPDRFEWVASWNWRDPETQAPRTDFLPPQPDWWVNWDEGGTGTTQVFRMPPDPADYGGWHPNRATFPDERSDATGSG